jgi:hypothetical protein
MKVLFHERQLTLETSVERFQRIFQLLSVTGVAREVIANLN